MAIPRSDLTYDVFISYSHADSAWVRDTLLPRIEQAGLTVCIDYRDFNVGTPSLVNMERAVEQSRHTLLVLTPSWVESEWAEFEALLTQTTDPAGRRRRLLPLLLESCRPSPRIAMLTYADFTGAIRMESDTQDDLGTQWSRLLAALRGELRLAELGPLLGRLVPGDGTPFYVPFLRNQDFQGREQDLSNLHKTLAGDNPVGIRPAGLTGMGGIGKTELAVEYCFRYADAYPGGVFWINAAEDWVRGSQGFAALGRRLDSTTADSPPDAQMAALVRHLRERPDSLLVLDNVADPVQLKRPLAPDCAPAGLPCPILFTTRRRDLGDFTPVEVTVLPPEPALRLLLRRPERQAIHEPEHPEHADAVAICRMLGYLPLALEIAGAFLGEWPEVDIGRFSHPPARRGPTGHAGRGGRRPGRCRPATDPRRRGRGDAAPTVGSSGDRSPRR